MEDNSKPSVTIEEVLEKHFNQFINSQPDSRRYKSWETIRDYPLTNVVLNAMQEWSSIQSAEKDKEIEALKAQIKTLEDDLAQAGVLTGEDAKRFLEKQQNLK